MSESEKQERIDWLEREIFTLDMKDHWDSSDYSYLHKLKEELKQLKGDSHD